MINRLLTPAGIVKIGSAASCLAILIFTEAASAAEVKLFAAGALTPAIGELVPRFEKSSGHKVTIVYGNINALAERIEKGEAADVIITSPARIGALVKSGRLASTSQVNIASVGAG